MPALLVPASAAMSSMATMAPWRRMAPMAASASATRRAARSHSHRRVRPSVWVPAAADRPVAMTVTLSGTASTVYRAGVRGTREGMSSTPASAQSPPDPVPTRAMEFDPWLDDLPRHFAADGDIVTSHVLAVLSSVFPDGEDYFVRSVEAVRDRITDPRLREDVEG